MSSSEQTPLLSSAGTAESSSGLHPHNDPNRDEEVTRTPYVTKKERRRDENSVIPSRPVTKRQNNGTHSPDDKTNIMNNEELEPLDLVGTMLKPRRAPLKLEPKVYFANERTLMAWTHLSVWLATAAVTILGFADANPQSQLYGITLVPVALSFILYAIIQYVRRAGMIRRRDPGPYEDIFGPVLLGVVLMLAILSQFAIKIYTWV
jgi:uncharacterized membrane protein YidH (DUF202 family)